MWKREEPVRPTLSSADIRKDKRQSPVGGTGQRSSAAGGLLGRDVVHIGKSVVIKGELSGSEDLTIEGQIDGKIELKQHVLTIGPNGKIKAQILAKSVVVMGEVVGNIAATDKISIRENGSVDGDVSAPLVSIAEGAHFRGSIDMQRVQDSPVKSDATSIEKSSAASLSAQALAAQAARR